MLPAVLLHEVEPPGPVDGPLHGLPHGQGPVAEVDHLAVPLPGVGDVYAAQGAVVGGLAAALGVEGGAVQGDGPGVLLLDAGADRGGEGLAEGVVVVEFFCHDRTSFINKLSRSTATPAPPGTTPAGPRRRWR